MKEFFKTKKGKITIGVIVLLILIGIILAIVFSGSSEKGGQKQPGGITIEQGKDGDSQQEEINTEGGLEVGDSLSESEDSLSVSGKTEDKEQGESPADNGNSDNTEPSLSEDETPNDEGSENGSETENNDGSVPKEAYGAIY